MALRSRLLCAALLFSFAALLAHADPAPFDLAGPRLEVKVTRGTKTLPISEVPNLAPGDRLWLHVDWPQAQAVHFLMVAAFLRGSTNPPPDNWFYRSETWNRKVEDAGLTITVPKDAQQLMVFLAPETGGDFRTLVNAVRGRPGAFVRASQDLNQASLDRSRLDTYIADIRKLDESDPEKLKAVTPVLARSLAIKVDQQCFDKETEQQAPCLVQNQDSMILNDGHSMSITEALTSGPAGDVALQMSYTQQANFGYYSPYIASVMDIARIMDSFHTAQYQYIPALASQQGDGLDLRLNTPPSFHNPKSVMVVALPAIEAPEAPPLHAADASATYCAEKPGLALAVEGAPLVFSTAYAHDMTLRLKQNDGKTVDVPVLAEAVKGGYVLQGHDLSPANFGASIEASLHGYWGFEKFDGPSFTLANAHLQNWEIAAADLNSIVVGRDDTVHLAAGNATCVDGVMLKWPQGQEVKADWKIASPTQLEVKLPLKASNPGMLTLMVRQAGMSQPQAVPLHSFSEPGHLESFNLHAGDSSGLLKGSRLDEVEKLTLQGVVFTPGKLSSSEGSDELPMVATDAKIAAALKQGDLAEATVTLKDGRTLPLKAEVEAPRPSVALLAKSVQPSSANTESNIQLANQDELPQDAKLTFSLKTQWPSTFTREENIEVATVDGAFSTLLSLKNGALTLQDSKIALATLDPAKAFGSSAFGPLQFRAVDDGVAGDWQPLANLVRLPVLRELKCPQPVDQACNLDGSNLFLVDSVASDAAFDHPVQVPDGFAGYVLPVPHPTNGQLYLKLRDDPTVVNQVTLAAQALPQAVTAAHANRQAPARPADKPDTPASTATQPAPQALGDPAQTDPAQTTSTSGNQAATPVSNAKPSNDTTASAVPAAQTATPGSPAIPQI